MDLPPSGWYPDPYGAPDLLRWWDGLNWTRHTHPGVGGADSAAGGGATAGGGTSGGDGTSGGGKHAELFDAKTGTFSLAGGELGDAWHFMSETRLRDGRVLMAGGYANDDKATAQAWIYVP